MVMILIAFEAAPVKSVRLPIVMTVPSDSNEVGGVVGEGVGDNSIVGDGVGVGVGSGVKAGVDSSSLLQLTAPRLMPSNSIHRIAKYFITLFIKSVALCHGFERIILLSIAADKRIDQHQ